MATQVNKITDVNVYLDGNSFFGQAEEIDLPSVVASMIEHKAVGMFGSFELPTGIDKMECRIKWNSIYKEVVSKMGDIMSTRQLQLRGNLEEWGANGRASQVPYVVMMTGTPKQMPAGNFRQKERADVESMLNVLYMRVEIDGEEICEVDLMANIYRVGGVDLLQTARQNLGI